MAVVRLLRFSHHRRQCAYWADRPQLNWGVSMQHASRAAMELPCIQRSIAVGQPIERRMPAPRD